jgi:hypothetical protein
VLLFYYVFFILGLESHDQVIFTFRSSETLSFYRIYIVYFIYRTYMFFDSFSRSWLCCFACCNVFLVKIIMKYDIVSKLCILPAILLRTQSIILSDSPSLAWNRVYHYKYSFPTSGCKSHRYHIQIDHKLELYQPFYSDIFYNRFMLL